MRHYTYYCERCKQEYISERRYQEGYAPRCRKCKKKMRRIFEVPSVQFKGKGFYSTDH